MDFEEHDYLFGLLGWWKSIAWNGLPEVGD
jgi:hypothetical protein